MSTIAETIRGINVVIGAETTGLSAALQDVNRQSRDIQGELKQVERLLRFDPGNTELLAQQQRLLSDAVATSREKLDRLRAAQEQVNQQFARGEISEGQYRAFQREVAAAEQQLSRFENRLEETNRTARNLGQALQESGEKMKNAGEKMSMAITAPIVAGGAVLLKGAIDAENATGKLQAALGLTADEAADLSAVAEGLWLHGFGESIEEATKAIQQVRSNMGVLAEDELQLVAEGAMTIADVWDQDVNDVTKAAGVAMKNFGISGQEALDVITVGFQKGGDYSGELLDTVREYSPQFASLGLTADQAMGMLIAGAQAGAWNLDKVGDSMKEFNIRAQDGSKTTADGFAAIGLNAQEMGSSIAKGGEDAQKAFMATIAALAAMEDPMAQNNAGVALFGTQWEDVRSQVIIAMAEGVKGLGDFQGATEAAAKAAYDNNPGLALTMAMRELQAAVRPALLPLADIISNTVVPAIRSMAEWFANLSPEGQKVALAIAGIVAAIGPALIVIGSMISSFTSVAGVVGKLAPKLASLVLGMGPIGIAIAAVVAAGILLYKNWDTIKAKAQELWTKLKEVWESIKSATSEIWKSITDSLSKTWDGIKETASKIWDGLKEFFKKWGADLLLIATGPVGWSVLLGKTLAQNWEAIKQTALNIWNAIKAGISGIWSNIISAVAPAALNLYNTVKSKLEDLWNYIKSIPSQALQWGKNIIQGLINGIKSLHIPLPHVGVTWDSYTVGGKSINVPDFGINWYDRGGIFTSPSVIGIAEKRPEFVGALDDLRQIVREESGSGQPIQLTVNLDGAVISRQLFYRNQGKLRGAGT